MHPFARYTCIFSGCALMAMLLGHFGSDSWKTMMERLGERIELFPEGMPDYETHTR